MFAKPQWFHRTGSRCCLTPAAWQGYVCHFLWAAVIALPALLLLATGRFPESLIWVTASGLLCRHDYRHAVRQQCNNQTAAEEEVFYIGDDEDGRSMATSNFNFRLRN